MATRKKKAVTAAQVLSSVTIELAKLRQADDYFSRQINELPVFYRKVAKLEEEVKAIMELVKRKYEADVEAGVKEKIAGGKVLTTVIGYRGVNVSRDILESVAFAIRTACSSLHALHAGSLVIRPIMILNKALASLGEPCCDNDEIADYDDNDNPPPLGNL